MEFEVVIAWPLETLSRVNFWRLKLHLSGCLIKKPQKRIVGTVFDQFWRKFRALIVPVGTLAIRGCVMHVKNIVPFRAGLSPKIFFLFFTLYFYNILVMALALRIFFLVGFFSS